MLPTALLVGVKGVLDDACDYEEGDGEQENAAQGTGVNQKAADNGSDYHAGGKRSDEVAGHLAPVLLLVYVHNNEERTGHETADRHAAEGPADEEEHKGVCKVGHYQEDAHERERAHVQPLAPEPVSQGRDDRCHNGLGQGVHDAHEGVVLRFVETGHYLRQAETIAEADA